MISLTTPLNSSTSSICTLQLLPFQQILATLPTQEQVRLSKMMIGRSRRLKRRTGDSAPASLSRWAAWLVRLRAKLFATGSTLIGSETLKPLHLNKILKLPDVLLTQNIPPTVGSPLTQESSQKNTVLISWLLEPLMAKVTVSNQTLLRLKETH